MADYTEARLPSEGNGTRLRPALVDAKVEADGDILLALADADSGALEIMLARRAGS